VDDHRRTIFKDGHDALARAASATIRVGIDNVRGA
jgi:hypothetical protein